MIFVVNDASSRSQRWGTVAKRNIKRIDFTAIEIQHGLSYFVYGDAIGGMLRLQKEGIFIFADHEASVAFFFSSE